MQRHVAEQVLCTPVVPILDALVPQMGDQLDVLKILGVKLPVVPEQTFEVPKISLPSALVRFPDVVLSCLVEQIIVFGGVFSLDRVQRCSAELNVMMMSRSVELNTMMMPVFSQNRVQSRLVVLIILFMALYRVDAGTLDRSSWCLALLGGMASSNPRLRRLTWTMARLLRVVLWTLCRW